MSELINVPSFLITQTDDEGKMEDPIWVQFYNGTICFEQNGQSINILPSKLNELFSKTKKNLPTATDWLNQKS